ncbi:DUF2732 family protein [Dickeya poaceiphila]|uniref:DUF2732 family protein n=1 Tax=Dickeya poaceiphila TaxID=568768 RepID=A0A5B8IC79_9GAMM|nr:DUF2732 family protein [Dickeya poaceiphila]QDX29890.1 DUF2732 family protein [Dickeya poaceiphila]
MKNTRLIHQPHTIAEDAPPNDVWRTEFAHRYSEHLEQLAQHAWQERLSLQALVALLQQEAEKIRHQIWETY